MALGDHPADAARSTRSLAIAALAALALGVAGCGVAPAGEGGPAADPAAAGLTVPTGEETTDRTSRINGAGPADSAARAVVAAFPPGDDADPPEGVVVADDADWQAIVAAASLRAAPLRSPTVLAQDGEIPEPTRLVVESLADRTPDLGVLVLGSAPQPEGIEATRLEGDDPAGTAEAIDGHRARTAGAPSRRILVVSDRHPELAVAAAGWAATTGDAVLFANGDGLPAATERALARRDKARVFVLGPSSAVPDRTVREIRRHPSVDRAGRVAARTPAANALTLAGRSQEPGWGIDRLGPELVVVNTEDPGDAAAATTLAGDGRAVLALEARNELPSEVEEFLTGLAAGDDSHAWIVGDVESVSPAVQDLVDELLDPAHPDRPSELPPAEESGGDDTPSEDDDGDSNPGDDYAVPSDDEFLDQLSEALTRSPQHELRSFGREEKRLRERLRRAGYPGGGRPGRGSMVWPVDGPVTSGFGPRWGRMHNGIDIGSPTGTPIVAALDGVVAIASPVSGYGNFVCLNHGGGLSTCYAHLSRYEVDVGDRLLRGEVLGLVGCTGRCFGDHLHFEVRIDGRPVDPLDYL